MQPNEVKHFMDLGEPVGREKKKAAAGLATTFGKSFLGRGGNCAFAKSAQHEAGTCTCIHAQQIVDAQGNVEREAARGVPIWCETGRMKKLFAVILIALAVAAAIWIAVRVELSWRTVTVPELLPQNTLLLVQAPDVKQMQARWRESALYQIWREPSVQVWSNKLLEQFRRDHQGSQNFHDFIGLGPSRVFAAVTSIDNSEPRLVGGFHFEAAPEEVRKFIEARAAKWWPQAVAVKRETLLYRRHQIENLHGARLQFASVLDDHWFFASNDVAALKALLDRADRRPGKGEPSLKQNEVFAAAAKHLPNEYAAMIFLDPQPFLEKLLPLVTMTGQSLPATQLQRLKSVRSVISALGFERDQMRERDFVAMPRIGTEKKLSRTLLSAAAGNTFFYSVSRVHSPDQFMTPSEVVAPGLAAILGHLSSALTSHGLKPEDLQVAFGDELEIIGQWPGDVHWPNFVASLPVADLPRARRIADALASIEIAGGAWTRTQKNGITLYTSQPLSGVVPVSLVVAITEKMLFVGTADAALETAIVNADRRAGELEKTAAFRDAAAKVPPAETAFNYLDTRLLFERLDAVIRPLLTAAATLYPALRQNLGSASLPPAEAIGRHLSPIVLSQRYEGDGYLSESVGPVTFREAALGMAIGVGASFIYLGEGLRSASLLPANTPAQATPTPTPTPWPTPLSI